ncbi:CBL-interacting serine/threonine-protein kinase 17 [Rhynchospora pubera]|uniref:non-specific serine/threonine protein kinase n=1 Tax=Rhynchospora pubera TaxID=906938 RepID=A0AAV8EBZ5_9POAL|nr:CBL-interacting serine/threonine-protein kinase 17 [Rhynchospora pubera]KAJ4775937.1 CBL-interacting serine/threonine-protein kinase 17 [Rhynchospora pubera]
MGGTGREGQHHDDQLLLGKYSLGRTLGEGNFGKVRYARHATTGQPFAVKILDRSKILSLRCHDQIKREIGTLKLLHHPNVVRLHEVSASKTKIYMVLEYVDGGELFDQIDIKGKLPEEEARKLFQQLIDGISYCHEKGIYHRDLKPENVLIDTKGTVKISDFGLSALPQHLGKDGLLHTTCGSPNYIAPEVLANRGYHGSMSDIWSCGVILYMMLVGHLPFEDRNIVVLYQKILKGETKIPTWLSVGAQNLLKRILDPNPMTRIDIDGIKSNDWFMQHYIPAVPCDDEEDIAQVTSVPIKEVDGQRKPTVINAFQLIGMSSSLDLSGLFEKEEISERKIRFTSSHPPRDLFLKIEEISTKMGFLVQRGSIRIKFMQYKQASVTRFESFLAAAEVFQLGPALYVVELQKSYGDSCLYRELCRKLSDDLGICRIEERPVNAQSLDADLALTCFQEEKQPQAAAL